MKRSRIADGRWRIGLPATVVAVFTLGILASPPALAAQQASRPYRIGVSARVRGDPIRGRPQGGSQGPGTGGRSGRHLRHPRHPGEARCGTDGGGGPRQKRRRSHLRANGAGGSSRERRHADHSRRLRGGRRSRRCRPRGRDPRPGGDLTGISSLATELTPKRLEILKAMFPAVRRVWAVHYAEDLSAVAAARMAQDVASRLKLDVVAPAVRTPDELVGRLKTLRPGDGLLVPPSVTMNIPSVILDLVRMGKWPALFYNTFWAQAGGLVSYGSDPYAEGVQAARLVARILRGERPQDLPGRRRQQDRARHQRQDRAGSGGTHPAGPTRARGPDDRVSRRSAARRLRGARVLRTDHGGAVRQEGRGTDEIVEAAAVGGDTLGS